MFYQGYRTKASRILASVAHLVAHPPMNQRIASRRAKAWVADSISNRGYAGGIQPNVSFIYDR